MACLPFYSGDEMIRVVKWVYNLPPILLAAILLGACQPPNAAAGAPTVLPPSPAPNIALTATFPVPVDFAFSKPLADLLTQAGVEVQSVGPSMMGAWFDVPRLAVSIQTDRGVIEAVYLDSPAEASVISIVPYENSPDGQYLYQVQGLPPLLEEDRVIDSGFPLYYLIHNEMLIQTASEELYEILVEALENS